MELVEGTEYEADVRAVVAGAEKVSAVERAQGTLEKHGAFTGRYVVNPVSGQKVPVWVADYIVSDYGTGAVMAVPCGDQRDFEFARKYDLPIVPIILMDDEREALERPASPSIPTMPKRLTGIRRTPPRARSCSLANIPVCVVASTPRARPRSWQTSKLPAPAAVPCSSACATGSSAASATGATPFRRCTASIAASCPFPRTSCR